MSSSSMVETGELPMIDSAAELARSSMRGSVSFWRMRSAVASRGQSAMRAMVPQLAQRA